MGWLKSMLSDGTNDSVSSKRVVTFLAFLLCGAAFICELVIGLDVKQHTFDSMMYIVLAGLGVTASEKFAPKKD